MNPAVRRYETSTLCIALDEPRVYPVYDTNTNTELFRFDTEVEAQTLCDRLNTDAVLEEVWKTTSTAIPND